MFIGSFQTFAHEHTSCPMTFPAEVYCTAYDPPRCVTPATCKSKWSNGDVVNVGGKVLKGDAGYKHDMNTGSKAMKQTTGN